MLNNDDNDANDRADKQEKQITKKYYTLWWVDLAEIRQQRLFC